MNAEERKVIEEEIEYLRRALAGETVNGAKIGDAGITREWVERTLANLEALTK